MKLLGLFLLLAGWLLVVAAIALLRPAFVPVFAVAGVAVQASGLLLLACAHLAPRPLPRAVVPSSGARY